MSRIDLDVDDKPQYHNLNIWPIKCHKVIKYAAKVWFIIFICKHQVRILYLLKEKQTLIGLCFLPLSFVDLIWYDNFQEAFNRWNIVPAFSTFRLCQELDVPTATGTATRNCHPQGLSSDVSGPVYYKYLHVLVCSFSLC